MKERPTFGIIGGLGKMGNWFRSFFEKQGFEVFISDKETPLKNPELVLASDIIFLALPFDQIKLVLEEIKPFLKRKHLLVEISSVKKPLFPFFRKLNCGVLFCHPLFGPLTPSLKNQIFIFSVLKNHKFIPFLRKIFLKEKAKIFEISVSEHDYQMSLIQGLPHFLNFLLGRILYLERKRFKSFLSTPFFRLQGLLLGRFFAQNPEIFSIIQTENPYFQSLLKKIKKEFLSLERIIEKKDKFNFIKKFNEVSLILEDFKKIAQLKSNEVLSLIEEQPLKNFSFSKIDFRNFKVGFLGPEGTFSHEAAIKNFSSKSKFFPFKNLREVFEAVNNGRVDLGIVPFENSITGLIGETINLLIEYPLFVSGSFVFPVCQALLARTKNKKEIKEICTISQAYFQCQSWIRKNFPGVKISFANSTTEAILKRKEKEVAFIGSPFCAKIYNLFILEKNIQDRKQNFTKFFLVSRKINKEIVQKLKAKKTLLLLAVYDRVGILRDILDVFAHRKINLTSLHSIPSSLKPWDYFFFLEAEIDPALPLLREILKELERFCSFLRFLGQS